jgi:hypothetical protein
MFMAPNSKLSDDAWWDTFLLIVVTADMVTAAFACQMAPMMETRLSSRSNERGGASADSTSMHREIYSFSTSAPLYITNL